MKKHNVCLMKCADILKSVAYRDTFGERVTVEAGHFEWQIVWEGGVTHANTKFADVEDNFNEALAYARERRSVIEEDTSGRECEIKESNNN